MNSRVIRQFLLPSLTRRFIARLVLLAGGCYVVFGHLLIPLQIQGSSMDPTYHDKSFAFCWRLQYLFSPPKRSDVVAVRFSGRKVMLLKRIVALPGETVEFNNGILSVDGKAIDEPYVRYRSDWNLSPRKVASGHFYVVGDNRSTSIDRHKFGQVGRERIVGGVFP